MSRIRKPATELKQLKARYKELDKSYCQALSQATGYAERLGLATREITEWKKRFDALLKIVGPSAAPGPQGSKDAD